MTASPWRDHAWACEWLGVDRRTLRRLMDVCRDSTVAPAWANVGSPARPIYRWRADRIDGWLQEVSAWQASRRAPTAT